MRGAGAAGAVVAAERPKSDEVVFVRSAGGVVQVGDTVFSNRQAGGVVGACARQRLFPG
jgi:hypothetical protein